MTKDLLIFMAAGIFLATIEVMRIALFLAWAVEP
jgi:hypothetical protein